MATTLSGAIVGVQGPSGPGSVTVGSVITARGALAVGGSGGAPTSLGIGVAGRFLRSNGSDPVWSLILAADLPTLIDATKIADGTVTSAEFQFINSLTSNAQTQLDGKAALAHQHLYATNQWVFADTNSQSAADTDNTASTVTWATAMDYTITLPTGNWRVWAYGGCAVKHSANGRSDVRVTVDGQDSTERTSGDLSTTVWIPTLDDDAKSNCTGNVHIRVQFRSTSSYPGTTFARNPSAFIFAVRTS